MEPWKLYLPLLVECGSHYYIKPLHELLSESPNLQTMKDQRIGYDSRLWDDVRGCGGFTTVTGIEDVERSIYNGYNTVLHELTHQVHGVFPPADDQRILDAYHAARDREQSGKRAFMSDYAGTAVAEYFAEGANGYYSPRRDSYDIREIVRERLLPMDTALTRIVEDYVRAPNLVECYPVGLVNAAGDAIEKQDIARALELATKAYAHAPKSEAALSEMSFIHSLLDHDRLAIAFADTLLAFHPNKTRSYTTLESAHFYSDGNTSESFKILHSGLSKVDSAEVKNLYQALGNAYLYAGKSDRAANYFLRIHDKESKDSGALWGLGLALGDLKDYAAADSFFSLALIERSGIIELRMDYARILIIAGRLEDAERQIDEAKILDAEDQLVTIMSGWLSAASGKWREALDLYELAMKQAPHYNLAAVLRVEALKQTGQTALAQSEAKRLDEASKSEVPAWVFDSQKSSYVPSRLWPAFQKDLLR
jgi:tetratricopeptide (TPR) repeat protein